MEPLGSVSIGQGYGRAVQAPAAAGTDPRAERQGIQLPEDRVSLSGQRPTTEHQAPAPTEQPAPTAKQPRPGQTTAPDGTSLEDPQIQQMVARMKQTEQKVKAHEAAHKAAGGNLASGASYSYTQGPDGRNYITGGEVQIDMSPGRTPQETVSKMQQVIRAALAPSDPSGQDRAVAAQAANQMLQAQQQKLQAESPTAQTQPGDQPDPTLGPADQQQSTPTPATADARKNGPVNRAYSDPSVSAPDSAGKRSSALPDRPSGYPTTGRTPRAAISSYA